MSHSVTLVLVPKDKYLPDANGQPTRENIEKLMEPFNENIRVDPYRDTCWCISNAADNKADAEVEREFGPIEDARQALETLTADSHMAVLEAWEKGGHNLNDPAYAKAFDALYELRNKLWKELTGERFAKWEQLVKKYTETLHGDIDCEECHGTGVVESRYNPKSKWDWWTIGGRWTDLLDLDYDPYTDPDNMQVCNTCNGTGSNHGEKCFHCSGKGTHLKWVFANKTGNARPVEELLAFSDEDFAKVIPFAVLTPDGEWHERGNMGWWGIVTDEKGRGDWNTEVKHLFEENPDTIAIVVDCHI